MDERLMPFLKTKEFNQQSPIELAIFLVSRRYHPEAERLLLSWVNSTDDKEGLQDVRDFVEDESLKMVDLSDEQKKSFKKIIEAINNKIPEELISAA